MDTTNMAKRKMDLKTAVLCIVICVTNISAQQEFLPSPPADHSLVYVLDQQDKLTALPFETATTPLRPEQVAKSTTTSYLQLNGEHSATVLAPTQRIVLFTVDRCGVDPPVLVGRAAP